MTTSYTGTYFKTFQHFFGVVEDRQDPLRLGRVRVRAFGIHTEDRSKIPTKDLPWATPIMPYTSASISGIGESPTGPVEGTWVFGFFIDGKQMQQPMIMGTLAGAPEAYNELGFNDPNKVYPKIGIPGESDVNRLARGSNILASTEEKPSVRAGENILAHKKKYRVTNIPVAGPPGNESAPQAGDGEASTVKDGPPPGYGSKPYYTRRTWNEPNPRYGGEDNLEKAKYSYGESKYGGESIYPLNHVRVTESGHVFEVDDSPDAERIHEYHTSGTFYEIQPNGTRVTKVVGDDYEMVLHNKNMVVKGNVNITVQGSDVRLLVQSDGDAGPGAKGGNMFIETDGDLNFNVRGDMTTKVGGTVYEEYLSDQTTNVNRDQKLRVGQDRLETIIGDHTENLRSNYRQEIKLNEKVNIEGDSYKTISGSSMFKSIEQMLILSEDNLNLKATSNVNIRAIQHIQANTDLSFDVNANTSVTIDAPTAVNVGNGTKPTLVDIRGTRIDLNKE